MKTKSVLINDRETIQNIEQKIQQEHKKSLEKARLEIEAMLKKLEKK